MSVYFVYRSEYEGPTGKYVKRFAERSVLAWFRNYWQALADYAAASQWVKETLGCPVYGFGSLPQAIALHSLGPPATNNELERCLREHLYVEGEIRFSSHALQVLTDDDEIELAYFFFDDLFLAGHGDRAAFLLHEDWKLPAGLGPGGFKPAVSTRKLSPKGSWDGTTYLVFLASSDSSGLTDLEGGYRIDGARLPELCRYLARVRPTEGWPLELLLLRSQLFAKGKPVTREEGAFQQAIVENPADDSLWLVYSDWLEERGERRADGLVLERALAGVSRYPVSDLSWFGKGSIPSAQQELAEMRERLPTRPEHDPSKSLINVEEHAAQLCLHTGNWDGKEMFHQWLLFDDLWASAHPNLANAILCYARRWDVLSGRGRG
jgi:uncharacterized protein (TIGR02996 family)